MREWSELILRWSDRDWRDTWLTKVTFKKDDTRDPLCRRCQFYLLVELLPKWMGLQRQKRRQLWACDELEIVSGDDPKCHKCQFSAQKSFCLSAHVSTPDPHLSKSSVFSRVLSAEERTNQGHKYMRAKHFCWTGNNFEVEVSEAASTCQWDQFPFRSTSRQSSILNAWMHPWFNVFIINKKITSVSAQKNY